LCKPQPGFNLDEAEAAGAPEPKELPCQALDHASGYLMALGTLAALGHRAVAGGSWQVKVSLARTGVWLRSLGRLERGFQVADPNIDAVSDLLERSLSGFGPLDAIRHSAILSETPAGFRGSSTPPGTDLPDWIRMSELARTAR
jgi:crotonobetainyl-CoA:carnitine CoA-transferase CaiB-like acyl-CoA transferase